LSDNVLSVWAGNWRHEDNEAAGHGLSRSPWRIGGPFFSATLGATGKPTTVHPTGAHRGSLARSKQQENYSSAFFRLKASGRADAGGLSARRCSAEMAQMSCGRTAWVMQLPRRRVGRNSRTRFCFQSASARGQGRGIFPHPDQLHCGAQTIAWIRLWLEDGIFLAHCILRSTRSTYLSGNSRPLGRPTYPLPQAGFPAVVGSTDRSPRPCCDSRRQGPPSRPGFYNTVRIQTDGHPCIFSRFSRAPTDLAAAESDCALPWRNWSPPHRPGLRDEGRRGRGRARVPFGQNPPYRL